MTLKASETPVQPIGYFIDPPSAETDAKADENETKVLAKFIRDGKEYEATEGSEVYPGDVILTGAGGDATIAFMDRSAVRLFASTEMKLEGTGNLVDYDAVVMNLVSGHASVAFKHNDNSPRILNFGGVDTRAAKTTGPAKIDLITTKDSGGKFTTNVAVTAGTVTLTPNGSSSVNVTANTFALLTLNTATNPASGNVAAGNLSKDQIKALQAQKVAEILLTQGKGDTASFKATIINPDGTVVSGSVTTVSGKVTKDSWKTTSNKKSVFTWKEDAVKGAISVTRITGNAGEISLKASSTGKASMKISTTKQSFTGTSTITAKGVITFTGTAKDGATVTYSYTPDKNGNGGYTEVVTTKPVGGAPTTFTKTVDKKAGSGFPPGAVTPDGRFTDQNSAPKSQ